MIIKMPIINTLPNFYNKLPILFNKSILVNIIFLSSVMLWFTEIVKCIQTSRGLMYCDKLVASICDLCLVESDFESQYPTVVCLSYDVASESEITPCNKIDKPLVVYRFTGYDVHTNVAYIMTKV